VLGAIVSFLLLIGWKRKLLGWALLGLLASTFGFSTGPHWNSLILSSVIALLLAVIPEGEPFAANSKRGGAWLYHRLGWRWRKSYSSAAAGIALTSSTKNGGGTPFASRRIYFPSSHSRLLAIDARWVHPKFSADPPVVFFDGVCGLCNAFVDWLFARIETRFQGERFFRASTQESLGRPLHPGNVDPSSIVSRTSGASTISDRRHQNLFAAGWGIAMDGGLSDCPKVIRDTVYCFVAKNRYKWFGRKETCRLPTQDERARFLL